MDYSLETPFYSFTQIQEALLKKTAKISFRRSVAYNIACNVNPLYSISNFSITIITVALIFVVCQFFGISKWLLLLGVALFPFQTLVPHLRLFFSIAAWISILLPVTIIPNAVWLIAFGAGLLGMNIGYDIWWGFISSVATKTLASNEELFQSVWNAGAIALKVNGNTFYHSN